MSLDTRRRSAHASQGARSLRRELRASSAPSLAPARGPLDWVAVALLMVAAVFVFFWNLTASGYANEFYSAAAQAGSKSWEAFLWGSLDAGNAITVDKPPASIWLMALSVRLLGLSSFAILLPQALMGVACTYLLYATVRRVWGNAAGIAAGIVFITMPVAALMFRFNNPDALLILLMLGAAACVLRGLELPADRHGNRVRTRWYAVAGLLIGLGFLTKQFQVLLVLPGFGLAMLLLSPTPWPRRLLDAVVALGSMVIGAGWWVLLTVLVPSGSRPYFGGSQTDSFIELTFSYNGLGRLTGNETGSVIPGASEALGGGSQGGMWGETGLFRLWTSDFGDQITWLAPIAFTGIALGLIAAAPAKKGQVYFGRFYQGKREHEVDPDTVTRIRRAQIVIFGAWLIMTWLVFSFMAGIFHAYYTVALSPAIAVLVAICGTSLLALRDRPLDAGSCGPADCRDRSLGHGAYLTLGQLCLAGRLCGRVERCRRTRALHRGVLDAAWHPGSVAHGTQAWHARCCWGRPSRNLCRPDRLDRLHDSHRSYRLNRHCRTERQHGRRPRRRRHGRWSWRQWRRRRWPWRQWSCGR